MDTTTREALSEIVLQLKENKRYTQVAAAKEYEKRNMAMRLKRGNKFQTNIKSNEITFASTI